MLLSALAAAIVAAAAPPPTATLPSPFPRAGSTQSNVRIVRLYDSRSRSCNARPPRERSGTIERRLNPVACEQPPRTKVAFRFDVGGELFGSGR